MSRTNPALVTNVGMGTAAKLKTLAKKSGKPFEQAAQRFVLEAAIRRIFASDHADKFGLTTSLKGGSLMFFSEGVAPLDGRTTTDIDLQISGFSGTMDDLASAMREALAAVPRIDDGVRFDVDQIKVSGIREGGVPGGAVTTVVQIGSMVLRFKADVGFYAPEMADTLVEVNYPSLLDLPPIRIYRQPIEYSISDKCHAAHKHSGSNTRLRDYYDLYVYMTKCAVDPDRLRAAFGRSWPLYGAAVPGSIDEIRSYSDAWAQANADAFRKLRDGSAWAVQVPELPEIVAMIRGRLGPVLQRLADEPQAPDASHLRDFSDGAGGFRPTLQ